MKAPWPPPTRPMRSLRFNGALTAITLSFREAALSCFARVSESEEFEGVYGRDSGRRLTQMKSEGKRHCGKEEADGERRAAGFISAKRPWARKILAARDSIAG